MKFVWTKRAEKELQRLPSVIQERIAKKMRFFAAQSNPLEFTEPLTDSRLGSHRFRIGSQRVIVDVVRTTATVVKVSRRDQAYD